MKKLAMPTASLIGIALTICSALTPTSKTQEISRQPSTQPDVFQSRASSLIIPQSRAYALYAQSDEIEISDVSADVRILQQVATTTVDIGLKNPSSQQREAEMLVPVPDGAVVRAFTFSGAAAEPTAKLLPKAEAQMLYRSIVNKLRDPALLEFAGYNLVRSNVFPVPARGTQKVRLVYEHILAEIGRAHV